ncbi:MAG: phosphogluconate dehydrogenase (NAD(+)-dependent, decarboxylating) [Pseudomonadota bacterium]
MRIGVIGLGRMGGGIARRLRAADIDCVLHDNNPQLAAFASEVDAEWAASTAALVAALDDENPRVVWVMVPAGDVTTNVVRECARHMGAGDVIIDGGNSYFRDTVALSQELAQAGVHLVDSGTSGGLRGEQIGYCLMVGGADEDIEALAPVFNALSDPTPDGRGFVHCGAVGSGHYTKMIQNGIEYGMMQSFAEGFALLRRADAAQSEFDIDLASVAQAWRKGSVVESWLLELLADALHQDQDLSGFTGSVPDSGTGRWTVNTALDTATPAHVLTAALLQRFESRLEDNYGNKVLSALRAGFGGHTEQQLFKG